jgi:RHS repeat-associated protein
VYITNATSISLTNSTISGNSSSGVNTTSANAITLSNNTFTNNAGYAAYLSFSGGTYTSLAGNSGSGNNKNGIALAGSLSGNSTLPINPNFPYIMSGLSVNSDTTLTLPAGSVIKMDANTSGSMFVYGNLQSSGISTSPNYFTSLKDDSVGGDTNNDGSSSGVKGDWRAIFLESSGTANFSYTTIAYGGYNNYANLYFDGNNTFSAVLNNCSVVQSAYIGIEINPNSGSTSSLSLSNSTVQDNSGYGIYSSTTSQTLTLSITNSTIQQNGSSGVYLQSSNSSTISNSTIANNSGYGVYNGYTSAVINAKNNWWGDPNGPKPSGNGNGVNYLSHYDSTCKCNIIDKYYVDFWPPLGNGSTNGQSAPWVAQVAEPVNTATGNYSYERTDLSIPTRSLPLAFSRSYNSSAPADGPLGYGWTFSYNVFITESSLDNSATVTYGDGRTVRFEWNGTSFVPPAGTFSTLVKSGGLFSLTEKDQTVYEFNASDRLSTITDRNGNITTLNYPGTLITSVTAPDGRSLGFGYDGSNRINLVSDPAGRTLGFSYDASGDLATSTDARGKVTTYTYDSNHRLLTITDANSHTFVTNTYNSDGRVSQQQDASGNTTTFLYDIVTHTTTVTDPRSQATTYVYDASLRLTSITEPLSKTEYYTWDDSNNRTSVKDKRGNTTSYTYDGRGNLLTTTNPPDPLPDVTTNTYDSRNNLLTTTDALDRVTVYDYDANNNLISKTVSPDGVTNYTTSYIYYSDASRNGLLKTITDPRSLVTTYDYNSHGDNTSITDALSHTSTRTYDDAGRLLTSADPLGHTTVYTYNPNNQVLTVTDPELGVTTNTYDEVGNLLTTQDPNLHTTTRTYTVKDQLETVEDAAGYVTTYGYDEVGNSTSVTDGNNHTTHYTYDGANRLTGVTDPLGKTTTYGYDENGNRISVRDANTHTTSYTFDKLNRQTGVTDALTHATLTTYDLVGNIKSVEDANHHITYYDYDRLNRLIKVTDARSGEVTYTYDEDGNRLTMKDANHHTTTYTYDDMNRLHTEADPMSHTWTYEYDAAGRRTSKLDAKGVTTTYAYDDADRLTGIAAPSLSISYTYDLAGNRTSMLDSTGTTTYTYDEINRPTTIALPNGTITYAYDAVNRTSLTLPGSLTTTYTFDSADRLTGVTDWGSRSASYTYDDAGRLITTTYPNGVVTTNTYDIADRLTGISTVKSATTILSITYTLDDVGNRLAMVDGSGTTSYTYDELNRLTGVSYPTGSPASVSYTYDAMGNRLTLVEDGVTTSYSYDAADRLTSTTGGSSLSFTWDNNGQMLTKGSQAFGWDALGRMTGLTNGGTTASYVYNGDGVRIGKTVDSLTTNYLQDLAAGLPVVMAETTGGNTLEYVYGSDLIAQVNGSTPVYYHADGLGSTRAMTDGTGASTDQYTYDTFGTVRTHSGTSANAFTYTGEQVDPEASLVFLRARYYDPEIGRFSSKDMLAGLDIGTQQKNRFLYAVNNPVTNSDPTGLDYIFEKLRLAAFGGFGGNLEIGMYTDPNTGDTSLVIAPGAGSGYGGGISIDAGTSSGSLPKSGFDIRTNLGAGSVAANVGVSTKYDFNGNVASIDTKVGSGFIAAKAGMNSNLDTTLSVAPSASFGAEASATVNYRFAFRFRKGFLGDWLFDTFYKPRYEAQYRQYMLEANLLRNSHAGYPTTTFGDLLNNYNGSNWGGPPSSGK